MNDIADSFPAAMLVRRINISTDRLNRDNVSRTRAYQAFWRRHPEIHWALLAAFVSRNAGYFMTDLKSGRHPCPVSVRRKECTFEALERSNWLIFRDAFPQLLLYDLSLRRRQDCFGLVPQVTRSAHMTDFWRDFVRSGNSDRLTRSLIANEQAYVERRVVRNARYRHIFHAPGYRAMEMFGRLHILLPPPTRRCAFRSAGSPGLRIG